MTTGVATTVFTELVPLLDSVLRSADRSKDVIVFDIDATVLYNNNDQVVNAEPNFKVQPLYDVARSLRVPVHFVTARIGTPDNRAHTMRQLIALGFNWFDSLYMRPVDTPTTYDAIGRYKLSARRAIERAGNKSILLNVGDQWTDLLAADAKMVEQLNASFPQSHVLFRPLPHNAAQYALKLFETQS